MQRSSTSTSAAAALGAVLLVLVALCSVATAFVPCSINPARAPAAAAAAAAGRAAAAGAWGVGKKGGLGSSSSRLYARISEKPGDKADREQEGEQGLPFLGGGAGSGDDEVPTLTRQQEEVGAWVGGRNGWLDGPWWLLCSFSSHAMLSFDRRRA